LDLDQLDQERGGTLWVRNAGETIPLRPASSLPWKATVQATGSVNYFMDFVWPRAVPVVRWRAVAAHAAWIRHNGLPVIDQQRRLVYMMQKYGEGVEYDLRHHLGVSAGQLWRDRRWRELLGYIDNLPANSQMNRLLSNDEEYMEAALSKRKGGDGPARPSMADWGQLESQMATLIDAVNRNTMVTHAVGAGKKAQPIKIDPFPRPATAAEKVEKRLQKKRHEELVGLLLPAKRAEQVS